jgi:serine phosphatase RsbU (regulator of sigma subunit)
MASEISPESSIAGLTKQVRIPVLVFATDRLVLPPAISARMTAQQWQHHVTALYSFLDTDDIENTAAAVLLDAADIHPSNWSRLEDKIHSLNRKNIPVILLNWPVSMELSHFRFASKIHSASLEELWARIELAMSFSLDMAKNPPQNEQQQQMEEQLKMAGAVQRNFLPQAMPFTDRVHTACIYQPAEWVSGDIYDAVRLDENHIGMYLADAVGHSIPAALLTMFLKHAAILRQTSGNRHTIFTPQQVLEHLNEKMIAQQLKGCLFATCCYGLLNTKTMSFTFARAGHPYPILLRRGLAPLSMQSRGGLLGVFEGMEFEEQTVSLQSGDKILIYSDGAEALIGKTDDTGEFLFSDYFLSLCELPAVSMLESLEHTAAGWKRTIAETDDITLLAMEIL